MSRCGTSLPTTRQASAIHSSVTFASFVVPDQQGRLEPFPRLPSSICPLFSDLQNSAFHSEAPTALPSREVLVALPTAPPARHREPLGRRREVVQQVAGVGVVDHRAHRHRQVFLLLLSVRLPRDLARLTPVIVSFVERDAAASTIDHRHERPR